MISNLSSAWRPITARPAMARIAGLDTGGTLFFDHADPKMVSWLNSRMGD